MPGLFHVPFDERLIYMFIAIVATIGFLALIAVLGASVNACLGGSFLGALGTHLLAWFGIALVALSVMGLIYLWGSLGVE